MSIEFAVEEIRSLVTISVHESKWVIPHCQLNYLASLPWQAWDKVRMENVYLKVQSGWLPLPSSALQLQNRESPKTEKEI